MFLDLLIYDMQNRKICMHGIFNFYATTVNISLGIYTVDLFTWSLGFIMQ
jgi:hypothetical protein